jgi:hypothetical protein
MSEETKNDSTEKKDGSGKDTVALELMKFIASSTGYGKGNQSVGFAGKAVKTPEEQADSLLELFEKCRDTVYKR